MRWIRQYTLYTYIKQRYHRRAIAIIAVIFFFSYTLSWLSPAHTDKIFAELSMSILEIVFVLWTILIAIIISNKRFDTTTHSIHSQWLSYKQIFIAHRSVGVTIVLWLCIVMYLGLLFATLFGVTILGIALISLYLYIKLVLLYTIVFVISHHIAPIITGLCWLALYILFYSIWLIKFRSQWLYYMVQYAIDMLVYILPNFVSIGQHAVHIDRLSANIFTIVISYGIYTICLLILGAHSYARTRWK